MAAAATWSGPITDVGADRSPAWAKRALLLSALGLILGLTISIWVLHGGAQSLASAAGNQKEAVLRTFENLIIGIVLPAGIGGAVFIGAIAAGCSFLRKSHQNE